MDVYEFILIPSSIVVGLGIAELFGGVVRGLRGELKASGLHSVWVAFVFLSHVQWLWASWELRGRGEWVFPEFMLFIVGPVGLYMAAAMLFPSASSTEPLDAHLIARRRPFFLLISLIYFSYSLSDWFVFDQGLGEQDISRLIGVSCFVILAVTDRRGVHWALSVALLALMLRFAFYYTGSVIG